MVGRRGNGEGSIYRRKDGRWVGQYLAYTPKGPKYRYLYGKTRQVVAEKLTRAMAQRDSGLAFEAGKLTVAEHMNKWITESARNRLRPKSYKDYSGLTRLHIIPALGHIKLKQLTPLHVQSFYGSKLESGLSKRTVEYIHTVLNSALKQAVRWELVPRNVTEAVDPPRPERKDRPTFNLDQARLFLEAARNDGWGALYVLAIQTGMRRGELFGLRWDDVNLSDGWLHVRQALAHDGKSFSLPKTAKGRRRIRLTPEAIEALKKHKIAQHQGRLKQGSLWRDHGLVFCSSVGTPMGPDNFIKRQYKPLLRRAELPYIRFHDLRHTFASLMMPNVQNPQIVQEMLGHSRISTTLDIYSHLSQDMQEEAVRRLGALFSLSEDLASP
jgi:integrase